MSALADGSFRRPLPPSRARALPWASVLAGSCVPALPLVAAVPLMPPFGLVMLLTWRLLAPLSLRRWAAAPLGLFDDLVSGQPLGSAVLLWSACFIAIDVVEQRLFVRDFWQDWLIAACAMAGVLFGGRLIAVPLSAHVDASVAVQVLASALLFPIVARLVAWIDRRRGAAA